MVSGEPDNFYQHALGHTIQIIPEQDPSSIHAGSALPVRVLFGGKPAADLQMEAAWSANGKSKTTVIGRTDTAGCIRVPMAAAGKWRLHTLIMDF